MLRRVSSISSGPLWCEERNRTACCFSCCAGLAVFQDVFDHVIGLIRFVANRDEPRPLAAAAVGPEIFREALAGETDHAIGRGEDRLRRAVVPLERDDLAPAG